MNLLDYVGHALRTVFGFYQKEYSAAWDKSLSNLLDYASLVEVSEHTLTLEKDGIVYDIWIANKFYSYGSAYCINGEIVPRDIQYRPSIKTMHRLNKMHQEAYAKAKSAEISDFFKRHNL